MLEIKKLFGYEVGFSDHTIGNECAIAAVAMGASMVEKHVTLDKTLPGPDHKASIDIEELASLVDSIRHIEQAIGTTERVFSDAQREISRVARKSIVSKHTIKKGDVIAILGASGSGKTTLLRCLEFFEKADKGHISIGDIEADLHTASRQKIHEIRQHTSFVFQNYNLFNNKNALDNVALGLIKGHGVKKDRAKEIAKKALEEVGLGDRLDYYPSELSGGQQQRVGIARALAVEPDVIFFDEPTSALDPELVGEVLETIRNLAKSGSTMVIVTHEMAFARDVATKAIYMDNGVIVEQGDAKEFFMHPREERTRQFLSRFLEGYDYVI